MTASVVIKALVVAGVLLVGMMRLLSLSEFLITVSLKETGGLTKFPGLGGRLGFKTGRTSLSPSASSPASAASMSSAASLDIFLEVGGCRSDKSSDLLELCCFLEPLDPLEAMDSLEPLELLGVRDPLLEVLRLVVEDLVCLLSQSRCR